MTWRARCRSTANSTARSTITVVPLELVADGGDQLLTGPGRVPVAPGRAAAGLGDLDQAVTAGTAALDCGRMVWPTMVLADKLDQALTRQYPRAASTTDYHARYLDAGIRLALPAPRPQPGKDLR